jgi:hypothetical protein
MASFIWEGGRINKMEKGRKPDMAFKLYLKSLLIKANL